VPPEPVPELLAGGAELLPPQADRAAREAIPKNNRETRAMENNIVSTP
jgi:hypothetical protein